MQIKSPTGQQNAVFKIISVGQSIDIKSQQGSLADALMASSFLKTFQGTLIADLALKYSKSSLIGGITDAVTGESNILNISFGD